MFERVLGRIGAAALVGLPLLVGCASQGRTVEVVESTPMTASYSSSLRSLGAEAVVARESAGAAVEAARQARFEGGSPEVARERLERSLAQAQRLRRGLAPLADSGFAVLQAWHQGEGQDPWQAEEDRFQAQAAFGAFMGDLSGFLESLDELNTALAGCVARAQAECSELDACESAFERHEAQLADLDRRFERMTLSGLESLRAAGPLGTVQWLGLEPAL